MPESKVTDVRRVRRVNRTVLTSAGLVVLALIGATGTATAASGPLPRSRPHGEHQQGGLPTYADSVLDAQHGQVFVSAGATSNSIAVVSLPQRPRGRQDVQLIDGQQGADGMVLSADGATLYVALASGDAISAIDTDTLKEKARYATQPHTCPTTLTRTGTTLWFGYGCDAWQGGIGKVDTSVTQPVPQLDQPSKDFRFERAPLLAATDGDTGTLVASQPHLSPVHAQVFTVDHGALKSGKSGDQGGSNLNDLAILPDGSRLLTAAGSEDHVDGFGTGQLDSQGSWFSQQAPTSVAASPDGKQIAVGVHSGGPNDAEITVYPIGGSTPDWSFTLPRGERLQDRGLRWAPDGSYLIAITQNGEDPAPLVRRVRPDTGQPFPHRPNPLD